VRVDVVGVGTELLLGDIVNSNAAAIGRFLADAGIDCLRHVSVGDNEERIAAAIHDTLAEADGVIVTGGLGPTQDDVTREAVCLATGATMVRDEQMAEAIRSRFRRLRRQMPENNLRQADRPENATPIPPTIGTAPGLIVVHDAKPIYLLPGVPSEMRDMMSRAVLPDLAARAGTPAAIVSRVVRCTGMAESGVAEAVGHVWDGMRTGDVKMAFLAGGGEVRIRLTAKAVTREAAEAALSDVQRAVEEALGTAVFGVDDQTIETVVLELLTDGQMHIACGESLTGGMLGSRLTDAPGASLRFAGSIVAYTNEAKQHLLGVGRDVLEVHGAVSAECAVAMARGARARFAVDVGVATTGVAGPDRQDDVDVGTVFVAVSGPRGDVWREVHLPGDRDTIRRMAVAAALNLVRLYLLDALT